MDIGSKVSVSDIPWVLGNWPDQELSHAFNIIMSMIIKKSIQIQKCLSRRMPPRPRLHTFPSYRTLLFLLSTICLSRCSDRAEARLDDAIGFVHPPVHSPRY